MRRFDAPFPGAEWTRKSLCRLLCVLVSLLAGARPAAAQLNENCVVSVLNRNVQVNPDGSWVLPNIPANFGPVRTRNLRSERGDSIRPVRLLYHADEGRDQCSANHSR